MALLVEELILALWLKIRGDVNTQSAVSFVDRFLEEKFRWAGWSGLDGESRWVVNKFA